ncbi:DNA polymerase [uncultured Blautia sp.]|uniref:DNA polymerase n=1 Tax=uncultured Blautia sp. TaxID=765821 RepID=UPI00280AA8F2|nr:DNA polymerase [uncultured Blautia sp.]
MINGTSALQTTLLTNHITQWSWEQYWQIIEALKSYNIEYLKARDEYTLFKEVVSPDVTEVSNFGNSENCENPVNTRAEGSGVISPICTASMLIDTVSAPVGKSFLAPLDVQRAGSIAEVIPSFKVIQSEKMSLNIGFDTEFQDFRDETGRNRLLLSLQMSISIGETLIRYFFLVDPRSQEVTADGGQIPLKYCLADILDDLKKSYFHNFPLVLKRDIIYKEKKTLSETSIKVIDFKAMKDSIIPITLICHTGKADISVFRRQKYDTDLLRKVGEIQGGWMTTESVRFKAENDSNYNYYWIINLNVRDTLGLTPAENKSLKALGKVIGRPKLELPPKVIENMASFAVSNPIEFYKYAVNDADIVVSFCSELFQCNHNVPMTLSSAAAASMYGSIKQCFGVKKKSEYDRIFRGLEMLDEGIIPSKDECIKYLRATRYVPIRDNPDAKLAIEYFEEAYTGGFNASFYIGWITEQTTDFDLQNAYPTAMANIVDIDWSKPVRDFPRNYDLTWQDLTSPLIPAVAVGDFTFPDDCYCPNIPVPVKGGMKIYPRHARHVYMTGPDMYLALRLGAKITVYRGFTCQMLLKDNKPSQCLAYAVTNLVQDRIRAKIEYKENPLVEKSLKTMVNSCYGKTAQNVSPKTRYNAKKMGRVDAEPSSVTSPYHAAYTTALVRCMLIACINQLHDMGYKVYSVTTDGFITNAPTDVVRSLDAYGFAQVFQNGRYILNQTREACAANQVWEPKHFNDTFLNITTRGNVAVNDKGVLAHNSYTTGEVKDSRADRDAYIIAVLSREGKLKCSTKLWTEFSEIVERKHDFHVTESIRQLSMNFDYKRCPITETAMNTPVHYDSANGLYHVDTIIAEYDTRPFTDAEEFLNYRNTMQNEDCIKVTADLERVKVKSTVKTKGYIGKDLNRKILLSILMGYRSGLYKIPALDGLKQAEVVSTVNSWGISEITISDWKNCSRSKRQSNMLPHDLVDETLQLILGITENKSAS